MHTPHDENLSSFDLKEDAVLANAQAAQGSVGIRSDHLDDIAVRRGILFEALEALEELIPSLGGKASQFLARLVSDLDLEAQPALFRSFFASAIN